MSVLQAAEASSHSGSNNHNYTHKTTEPGIKLPSSQYKGVIPQPNGRWGAQIYERHHRVWLGTFNNEEEAGKAYDRAARKFRGASAITNFLPLRDADPESAFLHTHSKEQIVDMLRRHTYDKELQLKACKLPVIAATTAPGNPHVVTMSVSALHTSTMAEEVLVASRRRSVAQEHLFDKALTPSDVGKLNRLVIPKQHAECCFPLDSESSDKGLLLSFEDPGGKIWRFRYSYWNSSQSYVLTKGWSRFVKEKKLEAGDIITFERDAGNNRELYISWHPHPSIPHPPLLSTPCLHFGFPLLPPSLWLNRNYRTPAAGRLQLLPPALRFLANSSDANNNSGRDKRLVQGVQSLWSSAALEQQHRIIAREVSERVVAASTVAFPAPTCSTVTENSNQTSNHDAVLQWSAKDETFECLAGRCKDATDISSSSSQKSKKHNDNNNSNDTMPTPILRLFGVNLSPPLQSSSWDNQPMCPHKRTAAAEEVPSLNSLKRRPCGDGDCDLSS